MYFKIFNILLLLVTVANAADNAVTLTPGLGVTMRTKDVGGGVQSSLHILGDLTGNSIYGTAGNANANILSIQGIASMTPILVTLSGTNNINSIANSVTVTGPLTDSQLRASAIPISIASMPSTPVTGTFWQVTQPVSGTFWQTTQPVSGTFWQTTQPISAANLPLPSGASTETTLALIKAKTDNIDVALSTRAVTGLTDTQLRASAVPISLAVNTPDVTDRSARLLGHVNVDNASIAVTGTFWQGTQPVSLASIPNSSNLDVALSTRLKPADTLTKVATVDTITNPVAVTGTFWQSIQPVSGPLTDTQLRASAVPVSVSNFPSTQAVSIATNTPDVTDRAARLLGHVAVDNVSLAVTGTFWQATQPISAASLPLPANAALETGGNIAAIAAKDFATSSKQDISNTSLAFISAKMPLPGNALSAYSQPVVIASDQRPLQVQMVNTLSAQPMKGRFSR